MKKTFNKPKKVVILIICLTVVLVGIAAAGIFLIRNSLITKAEASAVALADAGLKDSEVSALRTSLDFEDGRFQYEVDFYNDGAEYEYLIQARDGVILARDIEGGRSAAVQNSPSDAEKKTDSSASLPAQDAPPASTVNDDSSAQEISLDEAKALALADAAVSETEVVFTKEKLDYDNGIAVFDIEFYTADVEYDYEINAYDGSVYEKNVETLRTRTDDSSNSGLSNSDSNYIGADRAKEIALEHAQLSENDVQFIKAELERDDGGMQYDIEFYYGRTEYSYAVDAVSGNILEYDVDRD